MSTIDKSWIKLPRSFAKWRWYHDSNMVHLYLYLLLNANLEDEEFNQMIIHRGELYTSLLQLSSNTSLSIRSIRTCLEKLSKTKEIKYRASHQGRLIILVDFNRYQPIGIDEYCIDWIRLYRQICEWKWFHKSKYFHIFINFMIHANITTLDNGVSVWQCPTSLAQLNKETGISIQSIRTCIKNLQTTGEIIYNTSSTNRRSVITICNYDTYQSFRKMSDRQLTDDRQTIDRQPTDEQAFLGKTKIITQSSVSINGNTSSTYQSFRKTSDRQLTDDRQTIDRRPTDNRQTTDSQSTAIKEYKNIRKEEEKNIEFIDDDARTRERDFVEVEEVKVEQKENEQKKVEKESFSERVKSDERWMEAIMKRYHLRLYEVKQKLDDFELDLICRGKEEHKDEKDYKSHFCDWLNKATVNRPATSQPSPSNQYGEFRQKERWPGEFYVPKSSEGGIYEGKF